jgi:5'-nucleotidase
MVAAMVGAIGAVGLAGQASAQSYASTLSATVIDCGTATVTGADWEPNADITLSIASTTQTLGTVESDEDGAFTATFQLDPSLGNGDHIISAVSEFSSSQVGVTLTGCPSGRGLATTGSDSKPWVTIGVGLIILGAVLAVLAHRRRSAHALKV